MSLFLASAITAALLSGPVAVAPAHPETCAVTHQPARIAQSARPQYPAIAKLDGLSGTSVIRVDLSATGSVLGAYLAASSGSSILDQAAIRTAKSISYAPETRSCTAMSGSYGVDVEFAD